MDTSIWAPVVAAVATGALTGWVPLGVVALQRRHVVRDAASSERAGAYGSFLAAVPDFVLRIEAAAAAAKLRSGLQEGFSILFLQRKPVEPTEVFDWMYRDFRALQEARSRIEAVGSQAAIDAADVVVDACIEFLEAVATPDKVRSWMVRTVVGERWSEAKAVEVERARRAVFVARESFICAVRAELGRKPVSLPIARRHGR